ncbi:adenylate/guanylate cyclase domain-containing protein [Solwaraspora sp. WMMA2065]|uniref:ATP-binding protein n=1 Tax=Solwaraspora sp. WMMA2065 TaxID=3015166 RepID=UPI00259B9183|nr:adenylate/guanylate cyclase domain-containing protein [Solwaraspora sp. WMMA2065]WJK36907.1 adenylate/guanylate cyclase domain-containing protein [Solwaraspora sp. WMMA2065]
MARCDSRLPTRRSREEAGIAAPCEKCGRTAADDDRYCGGCGTALIPVCAHCERPLAADASFCTSCGQPQGGRRPTEPSQEDRRRVSVLFIDLINFTPYVERVDPEQVRRMQTNFFSIARRVVGQYGGVVEKYIGDAVMALFGAPVATENDALRCVRAGLDLRRALTEFTASAGEGLRFRIGVATGEALVDTGAARDGGQAFLAGDVVNTASRMQSVAPTDGLLVCGVTHGLTKEAIRYDPQPAVTLRGRSSPTEVWLALAPLRPVPADRQTDATPLIDREHELGLLVNALYRSIRDQRPQVLTLLGQAGIGKSRLVRELLRHTERLVDQPVTWRIGRCPPFGENVTFAALADIVKAEAGILDTDLATVAEQKLAAGVQGLVGPEADRLVDALRPLVGLPHRNLPAEETESAWRRFLLALAARQPTVLVFEDLHWADEAMLRFVELLGASARQVPLLLLCTARPELTSREPAWAGTTPGALTITLPPLRDTGVAALYAHMFGAAPFSADLLGPLIEVADGNPLYAHEYVRMLMEQGALRRSGRGWALTRSGRLPIPDSVHGVIANRMDLLDATDRAVLLAAAVVGVQFWPGAVAAALGQPVELVDRALRRLEQRDFVHEQPDSTMAQQPEFRFRHVLVRDVCYQRLPRNERVARHARTADWLDTLAGDRDTDLAEVLAHHRWAAHEIADTLGLETHGYAGAARDALHRAARRAYALHALDVASGHVERALRLVTVAGTDGLGERLQLELLGAELAFLRDGPGFLADGGTERLSTLADQLADVDDQGCAARAWTLLGRAAWLRTDRDEALRCLDRAVELFDALPDTDQKADAYAELGRLHMLNLERDPAVAAAGAAAEIADRLGLTETLVNARITVAMARYQSGDRSGLDELRAATAMCREHQLLALPRALQNLSYALCEEGDWSGAQELMSGAASGSGLSTGYSGEAMRAYFAGDFAAFLAAADAFVATPSGRWDIQVRGLRACLRVLRGDPVPMADQSGVDDVADAVRAARDSGFRRPYWNSLGLGALCRALQGRGVEAAALLDELDRSWSKVPALASGEWIAAAAFAAAFAGRGAAVQVRAMLDRVQHRTPWAEAALRTVTAAVAAADGENRAAGELYAAAAAGFADIDATTDRMIALALAVAAWRRGGDRDADAAALAEVRSFALRNKAPGLLHLGDQDAGGYRWSPTLAS